MTRKIITISRTGNKENSPSRTQSRRGAVAVQVCGSRMNTGGHLLSLGTSRWGCNPIWSLFFTLFKVPQGSCLRWGMRDGPMGMFKPMFGFLGTSYFYSPTCLQSAGSSSSQFAHVLFVIEMKWSQWGGENLKKTLPTEDINGEER